MRGEDAAFSTAWPSPTETPPRVWGRPLRLRLRPAGHGNTPTGVGKTDMQRLPQLCHEKHPHGCGEDSVSHRAVFSLSETPPRVWGRPLACGYENHVIRNTPRVWGRPRLLLEMLKSDGNTPTGVGKTPKRGGFTAPWWKHPHGCGEDTDILLTFLVRVK